MEYDAFGWAQTLLNRVCSRPNHLFQILIRRGTAEVGGLRDTAVSVALFPFLLAAGLVLSVCAAACGRGGVLRVWAQRSDGMRPAEPRSEALAR